MLLTQLSHAYGPPEVVDPEEAALLEIGAQGGGFRVREERRADVGGAQESGI